MSPYQALNGKEPPRICQLLPGPQTQKEIKHWTRGRQEIIHSLKIRLLQAKVRMNKFADEGRSEKYYVVGEEVYLKLQPYRQRFVIIMDPTKSYKRLDCKLIN